MIEKQSYQEPFSEVDKRKDDEMEIDLMAIFYKIITVRGVLCKAAGVGVIIAIVVALSIPKQYTVKVTLSPEMGNAKGSNGLAGLAASFLGDGALIGESTDALNACLLYTSDFSFSRYCFFNSFFIGTFRNGSLRF